MKIGEVGKKYGLSTDTLRYYIKSGLLIPRGKARYSRCEFRKRDLEDLELILRMKEQRFSLKDIMTVLAMRRTSNMVEPHTLEAWSRLYERQREVLRLEIGKLNRALESLEQEASLLLREEKSAPRVSTGTPLRALGLLRCPACGGGFRLEDAALDSRYIYRGSLRCGCGRELSIEDGVVETGNLYVGAYDRPDLKRELYTEVIGPFLTYLQKGLDKVDHFLREKLRPESVVMETHINSFFFAYNHLDAIPEDTLYIVVDRYPEMLREYKRLLENMGIQRDFLFIADNSMRFPLQEPCVDFLVSCMSDNEYCLYNPGSYIGDMKPFLRENAETVGTFLSFGKQTKSQRLIHESYPEGSERPYSRELFERQYREAGFHLTVENEGVVRETAHKGRFVWACHAPGDAMQISFIHATSKTPV